MLTGAAAADSPPGRHLPQVGARRGEASQPIKGRGSDELFVGGRRRDEIGSAAVQKPGVEPTGDDIGIGQQKTDELDVGDHPEHRGVGQGPIEGSQRGGPIRAVRDDLRQHRVVVAADDHARGQARIHSHTRRIGFQHGQHIAAGGQEAVRRILGIDPRLNRVPCNAISAWLMVSFSPAAIRTCHSTRSHPVTSSVTGCSTCSRVFISMKKNSSGRSAETMNSTVPAPV